MNAASWIVVICVSCLAAELFMRLPFEFTVLRMARCGARASHIIASRRISDHWKEKAMPVYAGRMARCTLTLTLYFAVLGAAVGGVFLAADAIAPETGRFLSSMTGLMAGFLAATVYYLLRRRLVRA